MNSRLMFLSLVAVTSLGTNTGEVSKLQDVGLYTFNSPMLQKNKMV